MIPSGTRTEAGHPLTVSGAVCVTAADGGAEVHREGLLTWQGRESAFGAEPGVGR